MAGLGGFTNPYQPPKPPNPVDWAVGGAVGAAQEAVNPPTVGGIGSFQPPPPPQGGIGSFQPPTVNQGLLNQITGAVAATAQATAQRAAAQQAAQWATGGATAAGNYASRLPNLTPQGHLSAPVPPSVPKMDWTGHLGISPQVQQFWAQNPGLKARADAQRTLRDIIARMSSAANAANVNSQPRSIGEAAVGHHLQASSSVNIPGDAAASFASLAQLAGRPLEEVTLQPYYAASQDRALGGGTLEQGQAFFGGLPGLGFLGGHGRARQAIEMTNSYDERKALAQGGQLKSFGENLFSHPGGALGGFFPTQSELNQSEATRVPGSIPLIGGKRLSGLGDLALQVFGDPLMAASEGVRGLAKVTELAAEDGLRSTAMEMAREAGTSQVRAGLHPEAAIERLGRASGLADEAIKDLADRSMQAGRETFLRESRTGSGIMTALDEILSRPGVAASAEDIKRAIGNMPSRVAEDIARAAETGGKQAALDAARQSIIDGLYRPTVTLRRQVLAGLGHTDAVGARGIPVILGPKTFSSKGVVRRALERIGRGDGTDRVGLAFEDSSTVVQNAIDRGTALLPDANTPVDFYNAAVAPLVANLDVVQRWERVISNVSETPYLEDLVRDEYTKFAKSLDAAGGNRLAGFIDQSEPILRRLETADMLLTVGNDAAAKQVETILRGGWKVGEVKGSTIARQAAFLSTGSTKVDKKAFTYVPEIALNGKRTVGELEQRVMGLKARLKDIKKELGVLKGLDKEVVSSTEDLAAADAVDKALSTERRRLGQVKRTGDQALMDGIQKRMDAVLTTRPQLVEEQRATIKAILKGEKQAIKDELASLKPSADFERSINRSADKALKGLGFNGKVENTAANRAFIEARISTHIPPGELQDSLLRELAAKGENAKDLSRFFGSVETLIADPHAMDQAVRMADQAVSRLDSFMAPVDRPGLGTRAVRKVARGVLSLDESLPNGSIRFESSPNEHLNRATRAADADRFLMELGFDVNTRRAFVNEVVKAGTEEDVYRLVQEAYIDFARHEGLDPEAFLKALADKKAAQGSGTAFGATLDKKLEWLPQEARAKRLAKSKPMEGDVKLLTGVQTLAQRTNEIPILGREEVKDIVRTLRARESVFGKANLIAHDAASPFAGIYKKVHTFWKISVVTNTKFAVPLAVAGFVGTDGSFTDKLKGAGIGFTIGALGGVRYIARLAGIEERGVRYLFDRGFVPKEWIPGLSKHYAERGIDLPFQFRDYEAVVPQGEKQLSNRILTSVDNKEWEALLPKHPRFLDQWSRIVNFQFHAESDDLARMMLEWRAGMVTERQLDAGALEFLKDSEVGQRLFARLKAGLEGPSTEEEAIARYKAFVTANFPDDVARARLLGPVDRSVLKDALKQGVGPDVIHAKRTWIIPRSFRDLVSTERQLTSKLILEGPTKVLNREPLARWIYHDEFFALTKGGVKPEVAQSIAEELAVKRTNELMFNLADESKFAKKADLIFPFQQPREEMLRVYGKLAVRNPAKTLKWTRLGALAFNNGAANGVFYKDQLNGQWYMTLPGSSFISRAMTGHEIPMRFPLTNLVFLFQGFQGADVNPNNAGDVVAGLAGSIAPRPGGLFWASAMRLMFNANPGLGQALEGSKLYGWLFPYGNTGFLFRPEARRVFQSFMFSPAPWEFASKFEQESELNRWQSQIALELIHEHLQQHPGDTAWLPDPADVKKTTEDFLRMWGAIGSVFPAGTTPKFNFVDWKNQLVAEYKAKYGEKEAFLHMMQDHPEAAPFFQKTTMFTNDSADTFDKWARDRNESDPNWWVDFTNHNRRYLSYDEFSSNIRDAQRTSQMWQDYHDATALAGSVTERERIIEDLTKKYPELPAALKDSYFKLKELALINAVYPSFLRDSAINAWRKKYGVSYAEYKDLLPQVKSWEPDIIQEVRDTSSIWQDIQTNYLDKNLDPMPYISSLPVGEQYKAAQAFMDHLNYHWFIGKDANPDAALSEWYHWKTFQRDLVNSNPALKRALYDLNFDGTKRQQTQGQSVATYVEQQFENIKDKARPMLADIYDQTGRLTDAMQEAASAKRWSLYYSLKSQRQALYDKALNIKNALYKAIPDIALLQEEVKAQSLLVTGTPDEKRQAMLALQRIIAKYDVSAAPGLQLMPGAGFLTTDEQAAFLSMPRDIRQAYIDNLYNGLTVVTDKKTGYTKLQWSYLTDFQKNLLERNLPQDAIQAIQNYKAAGSSSSSGKSGGRYYSSRKGFGSTASDELAFAYSLFKQYNRRTGPAPAAYQEYLNLPQNPAVRAQFLKGHPDVAQYLKDGPLANMPELYRYMVTNIMVKYGKWQGEERTIQDITELAWARQQLDTWNRRGGAQAPEAYDLWVNMPSGPEKAVYLQQHPEIGDWLRLGPMANMPDAYREVVRDIMLRYGEWTQSQDALGNTIQEYFSLPGYARADYLNKHPELTAYWAALRTPEEQHMADLATNYFALPDGNARRLYMATYPELQQYFVDQRQKRYERFLNQVAVFMGSNPDMFETYLSRQTDILSELLRRYGQPVLVREASAPKAGSDLHQGDSGRVRKAA